jgi:hypothetical protein
LLGLTVSVVVSAPLMWGRASALQTGALQQAVKACPT